MNDTKETAVSTAETAQVKGHKNAIAKTAFGQRNFALQMLVENASPKEALEILEALIVKTATARHWRTITYDMEQFGNLGRCDTPIYPYFCYWQIEVVEALGRFDEWSLEIGNRLIQLIERIKAALPEKADKNNTEITSFEEDALFIMAHYLLGCIVISIPKDGAEKLWDYFLNLNNLVFANKENIDRKHSFGKKLCECVKYLQPPLSHDRINRLMRGVAQHNWFFGIETSRQIIYKLWGMIIYRNSTLEIADITECISPLMALCEYKWAGTAMGQASMLTACRKAIERTCNLAKEVSYIGSEAFVRELGLPIYAPIVKFDWDKCQVLEITVKLDTDDAEFRELPTTTKKLALATKCQDILEVWLVDWISKNQLHGFTLTIAELPIDSENKTSKCKIIPVSPSAV
jgi:hypothetical protein